jgi:transposase InsO family protein
MDRNVHARLKWVRLYQKTMNAGYVCLHCGISRPTLRKWVQRYNTSGYNGLFDRSRRPKHSPCRKVNKLEEMRILDLRVKRNLGARRIQNELIHRYRFKLSLATIHKVLANNHVPPLKKLKRTRKIKRYQCSVPGERVQMDTMKISSGLYQYTAIDDCTRCRVLRLYPRRSASNTIDFIQCCVEELPFPIQRIQTDRGSEFFAFEVQKMLMEYCIKFRPNKPGAPHLNGKVERSQKTDLEEFYALMDMSDHETLKEELGYWQHDYNWHRPHGAFNGKTPMDKYFEVIKKHPFQSEVESNYLQKKERFQDQNYYLDKQLKKLKQSL